MTLTGKEIQNMTTTEMFPKEAIEVEERDTIRMEVTGINRSVQTETSKLLWQIAARKTRISTS